MKFNLQNFREEVVHSLAGLDKYGSPYLDTRRKPVVQPSVYETVHMPTFSESKRNCKLCYLENKKELKVKSYCAAPQCNVYLHCTAEKNCFVTWYSADYHGN